MEHEILCPECEGDGYIEFIHHGDQAYREVCPVCTGDRYITVNDEKESEE